jgi:hypothetical protein
MVVALSACLACGAETRAPRDVARAAVGGGTAAASPVDAGADAPADAAPDALPTAARIAARGRTLAPSMREIARIEGDAPLDRELVRAAPQDTCARVAFAAGSGVRVTLTNGRQPLVELPTAASGVAGPACARKGDPIILRISSEAGATTAVRAVAWVSP